MTNPAKTSARTSSSAAGSKSPAPDRTTTLARWAAKKRAQTAALKRVPKTPGRKPHKPTAETRARVESLAGMGHGQDDICLALGLGSTNTLVKHYALELRMGRMKANNSVAESLFKQATAGANTTAGIWWEKTRAGRSERVEHTGEGGGPVKHSVEITIVDPRHEGKG